MEKRLALTKDGKLTYCTAPDELVGKGRCNHIAHQSADENKTDFLNRISKIVNKGTIDNKTPKEIVALNDALSSLDKKLINAGYTPYNPLVINAIGGYATYHLTWNATMDIDSVKRIEDDVKLMINEVALENGNLEADWLNDDPLNTGIQYGEITAYGLKLATTRQDLFEETKRNLDEMQCIKVNIAKPELVCLMKFGAIEGREKQKDKDDIIKICKSEKWSASDLWDNMSKLGFNDYMEPSEYASITYEMGLMNENEYVEFITKYDMGF